MKELYITDLDGTLLDSTKSVSPYSIKVINQFIEKEGLFSVATARTAGTVVQMLNSLQINCPVVLMNGAMIFDIEKKSYLKYEIIEKIAFLEICDMIKKHDANGFLYTLEGSTIVSYYERLEGDTYAFYNQRRQSDPYKIFKKTENFKSHGDEECVYFALMDTKETLLKVYAELTNKNIEKTMYQDIYSGKLYYLEIFSKHATKANGVKFVKEYLKADKVIAFGDNHNDLDMLKMADVAVVPKNAIKEAKEIADVLCKANTEDGVARYINEKMEV